MLFTFIILTSSLYGAEHHTMFQYQDNGRRDPFVPLMIEKYDTSMGLKGVRKMSDLELEGVIWDPLGESFVIVNGEILKKDQEKHAVKVHEIEEQAAMISISGRVYRYELQNKGDV